jgi:putative YjhG/YagF family dehydratase
LLERPSGDLFGWSQNAGMGWNPATLGGKEYLILSTHGGIRAPDGTPIALGYHTGHWEVGLLMQAAAEELKSAGAIPFAGFCTDPCDGRTQGTTGMFDSLPYRNDAAQIFRRLIRSLPTRSGVLGVATCDKGLPGDDDGAGGDARPAVRPDSGRRHAAARGRRGRGSHPDHRARFAHGAITLEHAGGHGLPRLRVARRRLPISRNRGDVARWSARRWAWRWGHSALAPSGHPIWLDMARRSARAVMHQQSRGIRMRDIVTDASISNALAVHAAFGGSTNLILHVPAIAHAAGLARPTSADWARVNRKVPRIVDALPNGPRHHPTVQVFLAGAVPEVMLHLRREGLIDTRVLTASGLTLGEVLDDWEKSERRRRVREVLLERDGIDPDDVIMSPEEAARRGLTSTVCFPHGNLAPDGSVIKSTAIDPSVVGPDGVYRHTGPAKVFLTEPAAIAAIKESRIQAGDVLVLACRGPMGAGMEETCQLTAALKYLDFGKHVAILTDARFSGFSTGACIGHVRPEALAGGPIGKLRDGDMIEIVVDCVNLEGSVNLVGGDDLDQRPLRSDLARDPQLPDDSRLWAALQDVSGGTWGGAVFDVEAILEVIEAGKRALDVGQAGSLRRVANPPKNR